MKKNQMHKIVWAAAMAGLGMMGTAGARAAGTTTAEFMKVSPDSRSASMGSTGVSDPGNGFSAFHNPALPAAAKSRLQVSAGQTQWILNTQISHYAGSFRRETASGAWALGVTFSQWSAPSFQTTDNMGNVTGNATFGAQSAGLSLGRSWGDT